MIERSILKLMHDVHCVGWIALGSNRIINFMQKKHRKKVFNLMQLLVQILRHLRILVLSLVYQHFGHIPAIG